MALTVINLTDPVSSLVTKTNTISADLGDASTLLTTATNAVAGINELLAGAGDTTTLETTATNIVDAINEIRAQIIDVDDSSEVVAISRGGLSVNNDSADPRFSLSYDTSTGVIKLKANLFSDSAGGILYDSAAGQFSIAPNTIRSNRFYNAVSLVIYDNGGSPVKTLYSPGA